MEKIFKTKYNPDLKVTEITRVDDSHFTNMRNEIYDVISRNGSEEGYVIYIPKRELGDLLDKDDGR